MQRWGSSGSILNINRLMKIGILGGSFNPPHHGHLYITNLALKKLDLDQIWWVVTERNPLKNSKDYESHFERVDKCRDLIGHHPKIKILQNNEIYTENLISRLKVEFRQHNFIFIIGADVLEKFHLWKNFRKIISSIDLAIFSRGEFLFKAKKFPSWKFIKSANRYSIFFTQNHRLSSTKIREVLESKKQKNN